MAGRRHIAPRLPLPRTSVEPRFQTSGLARMVQSSPHHMDEMRCPKVGAEAAWRDCHRIVRLESAPLIDKPMVRTRENQHAHRSHYLRFPNGNGGAAATAASLGIERADLSGWRRALFRRCCVHLFNYGAAARRKALFRDSLSYANADLPRQRTSVPSQWL